MHPRKSTAVAAALAAMLVMASCASRQVAQTPDWFFHDIVDAAFVQPHVKVPQPEGVMIIDSRPYKAKYAVGHIPTAVNIPDSQFDKMTDQLPADKDTLLIFYCEGPT